MRKRAIFPPFTVLLYIKWVNLRAFPSAQNIFTKRKEISQFFIRNSNEQLCHIKAMLKDFYSNGNSAALSKDPTELELPAK